MCIVFSECTNIVILCGTEGSARPLFPQWSHHVYPQFLPGSHPNATQHQHTYVRHRHSYAKHHYNLNNNHHSHHHNHKIDHRYHRNSIASHAGNWTVVLQYRNLLSLLTAPLLLFFLNFLEFACKNIPVIYRCAPTYYVNVFNPSCLERLAIAKHIQIFKILMITSPWNFLFVVFYFSAALLFYFAEHHTCCFAYYVSTLAWNV